MGSLGDGGNRNILYAIEFLELVLRCTWKQRQFPKIEGDLYKYSAFQGKDKRT
jgi:hypothetical protein